MLLSAGSPVLATKCKDKDEVCSIATKGSVLLQGDASRRKHQDEREGHISVTLPEGLDSGDELDSIVIPRLVQASAVSIRTGQSTDSTADAMQTMLDVHNWYRCLHGASQMTWDDTLARKAQEHADAGPDGYIGSHSSRSFRTDGSGFSYVGENLAWSMRVGLTNEASAIIGAEGWYNEIEFTDGTPIDSRDTVPPGSKEAIGHYTQMIWDGSNKLGCGLKVSDYSSGGRTYTDSSHYWVCMYGPGGNIRGRYSANVFAASVDKASCDHLDGASLVSAAAPATAVPPAGAPAPPPAAAPAPPAPPAATPGPPTPAPATPAPPTPAPPTPPIKADCHDADPTYISCNGRSPYLPCSQLKKYCPYYRFVRDACMITCDQC